MASSSSLTGRNLIYEGVEFPCYSEESAGPMEAVRYTVQKEGEEKPEFLSSVDVNGKSLLITRRAVSLSELLGDNNDGLPYFTVDSLNWIGGQFKVDNLITALSDDDFRCLSVERRVICAGLLRTIIPQLKKGICFRNITLNNIFVELAPTQTGLACDDLSCTIYIVPMPALEGLSNRRRKEQQTKDLRNLSDIIFNKILPRPLFHDLDLLQRDLKTLSRVFANVSFISEHPSLWSSKKRLFEFQNFLETYLGHYNTGQLVADDFYDVMISATNYVEHLVGKTWIDIVTSFHISSPVINVFKNGYGRYGYTAYDFYKYVRNFEIHGADSSFPNLGTVVPYVSLYNDKDFVNILLSRMFPGLLIATFEESARRGLYFPAL